MAQRALPTKLPPSLYGFFWDVDAKKINPTKSPYYVVNRLLDKGNIRAIRWVLSRFPRKTIIDTFKKMRDFSPWNGRFWARYLNIPEEEVACLGPYYLATRRQHWPY